MDKVDTVFVTSPSMIIRKYLYAQSSLVHFTVNLAVKTGLTLPDNAIEMTINRVNRITKDIIA